MTKKEARNRAQTTRDRIPLREKKVLDAAGVKADTARIKALTASLDGVNIEDAISTSVAVPTAAPAAGGAPVAEPAAEKEKGEAKADEKKEKKKKEEKKVTEEEAAAGLGALFG